MNHDRHPSDQCFACVEKNSVQRPLSTISSVGPCPMVVPSRGKPVLKASSGVQVFPWSKLCSKPV